MEESITTKLNGSGRVRIGDLVTIVPRGKRGIYTAEFLHDGNHTRRSLKTANLKVARPRAMKIEMDLAASAYSVPPKPASIDAAREQYVASLEAKGRASKTVVAYKAETAEFAAWADAKGVDTLADLAARHFTDYRGHRQPVLAAKTLYTRLIIIKSFLNWCCGEGALIEVNPFRRCRVDRPYIVPKFTPTPTQVAAVLAKAAGGRAAQYATLAFSGLRVGELSMLRPQDVDLKNGWIHIVGREGWMPKTRQARRVPIHPRLMTELQSYAAKLSKGRSYFFSDAADGARPINVRTINVDVQLLAKAFGVPTGRGGNGMVLHSLRHYFETQAVDSGIPQFVVDSWMGHSGQSLMGRHYYGMTDEKSHAFMKRVNF